MKLNIGAGDTRYPDYLNVDYDSNTGADIVVNLETEKLPLEDNTVDAVIAHHVLEHLGEGYFNCLQELYRVCKHGAIIDIRVPHPRHDTFLADPTHRRPITTIGLQLFSKKFNKLCREQKFASSRLGEYFNVDFEIIDYQYIPDQDTIKLLGNKSNEELEALSTLYNNMILEIHIKLAVVKDAV